MRAYQVFAAMTPDHARDVMGRLAENAPQIFSQAVIAASAFMNARPVYLQRQPFEKRTQAVRRAMSRVKANDLAEEMLAVYFLECRKELLAEWLDILGIEHENGTLKENSPASPKKTALVKALKEYRAVDKDPDRELLVSAFAAQSAVDWPDLEALIHEG